MKPSRRQLALAGFLTVFALGFCLICLVPGAPLVPGALAVVWLAAGIAGAWRLFPDQPPRTPDLTVPDEFLPPQPASEPIAVAAADAAPVVEMSLESDDLVVEAVPDVPPDEGGLIPEPVYEVLHPEPSSPNWGVFQDLLTSIEADWGKADPVSTSLGELSGNAAFIRENVQRSYEIADNLAGSAQRAFSLSEKVQKGVVVVTEALMESLKQAEILEEHSERITGILQLMAEVSDKIHVLSINASIVSARAGTAGRGFEVVAKEIRALAKDTEHSLGDIIEVINLLRSSITRVIDVVREADAETEQEKSSLIEVAGALQGVILGVEIVKAVSGFAKDKAEEQDRLAQGLSQTRGPSHELRSQVAAVKARLEEWKLKE